MLYFLPQPERLGEDFWKRALPALSAERQRKVQQFRFARDKVLSAVAYLLLRFGLHHEYGLNGLPAWRLGPHGKPYLTNDAAFFSLSHCHDAVICAIDREEIGADVEAWRAFAAMDAEMLRQIFSQEEQEAIRTAATPQQTACDLWTAKESVCKFTGEGINDDLPVVLHRTDIQLECHSLAAHALSIAVCRGKGRTHQPLPCREVTSAELQLFLSSL